MQAGKNGAALNTGNSTLTRGLGMVVCYHRFGPLGTGVRGVGCEVKKLQFSLIVATIDRIDPMLRLLDSLAAQARLPFELIVADQNEDDRIGPIVDRYSQRLRINRLRVRCGLSAARNDGLAAALGRYVAFPDDDCWYLPGTLAAVDDWLKRHPAWGGVSVACCDTEGRASVQDWPLQPGQLTPHNLWRRAVSVGIFIRREAVVKIGGFDESLGAGSQGPWKSGEETDLLLRLLRAGVKIGYWPEKLVGHGNPTAEFDAAAYARALEYGRGLGRVLAKHHRPLNEKALVLMRPMMGAVMAAFSGRGDKGRFYMQSLKGRWQGLRGTAENDNLH